MWRDWRHTSYTFGPAHTPNAYACDDQVKKRGYFSSDLQRIESLSSRDREIETARENGRELESSWKGELESRGADGRRGGNQ